MWTIGNQKIAPRKNINAELTLLEGELKEAETKTSLAKFLRYNLGFTFQMISGVELLEYQEIILNSILSKDNSLIVGARGSSKSTLIGFLAILYSIFYPGGKFCIISSNFRNARRIIENVEKVVNNKAAKLLKQCFRNPMRRAPDLYKWDITNGSEIFALPLTEGLRGTRANCVVIDEGLMISKDIQDYIIRPFLTNKADIQTEMEIRRAEDELIKNGAMTEDERTSFDRNKYIIFSSASYEFEYLYEIFSSYIDNIEYPKSKEKDPPSYFVMRLSYEAIPPNTILDMSQIESAKEAGGEESDYFRREYRALFSSSSDGYYNAKKLKDCTVKIGDAPTLQLYGHKDSQYLLSIDPSYSASKGSDFFAMGLFLLVPEVRKIVQVHTYGKAGGDLREHFEYFTYLLTHFNIVFIVIDASGSEFISGYNESFLAKERNLNMKFLNVELDPNDTEYLTELVKIKNEYNIERKQIVYGQKPTSQYNRTMNEHLQNQVNASKVWFGSPIQASEEAYNKYKKFKLPYEFKDNDGKKMEQIDFISDQEDWITETKAQTALIQVKSTTMGTLQYDLPQNLRRSTDPKRPRKDNFTCLLMGNWGAKLYYDIVFTEAPKVQTTFDPQVIATMG